MNLRFDHNYAQKFLTIEFASATIIRSEQDVNALRQTWLENLSGWHSPYKALIDCSNLDLQAEENDLVNIGKGFGRMNQLLSNLFLRKAACFGIQSEALKKLIPFSAFDTAEEAAAYLGIRKNKPSAIAENFRDTINFENHFKQHVVELSFSNYADIDSSNKIDALKSKLTNNLMQWHSGWSLLIDCSNLKVEESQFESFHQMTKFFRGFFLKEVIGYSPFINADKTKASYPFAVYRSRHKAAAQLEAEGNFSGGDANCASRKA